MFSAFILLLKQFFAPVEENVTEECHAKRKTKNSKYGFKLR
jgi:hypothetical protein